MLLANSCRLCSQLAELRVPVPVLCSELEAEQQLRSEAQQQLQRRRQQHEAALHQLVTTHEVCRASLHTTQQQLHEAEAAADTRMQQVLALSSRGSELQQALTQAQQQLSTTAAAAEGAEQRAANMSRELSARHAQTAVLQQDLEAAQGAAEGMERRAADMTAELPAWRAQAAVLQQRLAAAQGAAESSACQHSVQVAALQQQLDAAQEAADSAAQQHSEQEGQLRWRLEAASQSLADGQAQADFLRRQLAQAATVQSSLHEQHEALQGRVDELGSALTHAREQQAHQVAADAMQRNAVCQAESLVEQREAEQAQLAAQLAEARDQAGAAQQQVAQLSAELAHTREQAAAARQQVEDRQAAFTDQMQAALQQHQQAEQGLQQQLSTQQAEVLQLSAALAAAQRQLSSLQQEHSATTQALQEELTARVAELAASLQSAQQASAGHEERACHLAREVDGQRAALADARRAAQEVDSQRAALADAQRGALELEQKVKAAEAARASAEAAFAGGDVVQHAAPVRSFHVVTSSKGAPAQPVPHGHASCTREAHPCVRGHRRLTPGNGGFGICQPPTRAGSTRPTAGVQAGSLLPSSCSGSSRMPGQTSRPCRACCSSWRETCSAPCASWQRGESWYSNWTSRSQ